MTEDERQQQIKALHGRVTDVFLRFEALRVTLEQLGILPRGQFDRNLTILQEKWEQAMAKSLARTLQDENRELMRLLLELHEGTKQ